jgi:hypothetical protein
MQFAMPADSSIRKLDALKGASSSRVLNLLSISHSHPEPDLPLFHSSVLNSSIILKHRLRSDETSCFEQSRPIGTKIIVPFEKKELRLGGQSLFIGQRGFDDKILDLANFRDPKNIEHDLRVLKLIDAVPSLDPFILREYLRSNGIMVDACYFQISPADQRRMYEYTAAELGRLTAIAANSGGGKLGASANKLTSALLSNEVGERLEPLRLTLNLDYSQFQEGIFGWRGFIYYKWSLEEFWPRLMDVLRSIKSTRPSHVTSPEISAFLERSKTSILKGAKQYANELRQVIDIYNGAYATLVENQHPKLFREFLLNAPSLFLEFGEKMGAISHIATFWQYRFAGDSAKKADADELAIILEDFARSLGRNCSQTHILDC